MLLCRVILGMYAKKCVILQFFTNKLLIFQAINLICKINEVGC